MLCRAGAVPIGQPGGSAEELRPAFPLDAVLAGVYDMDVPSSHAAPVLEVSVLSGSTMCRPHAWDGEML